MNYDQWKAHDPILERENDPSQEWCDYCEKGIEFCDCPESDEDHNDRETKPEGET